MDYHGEYIVLVSEWPFEKGNDDIKAFIEENYFSFDTINYSGYFYELFKYYEKEYEMYILKRKNS